MIPYGRQTISDDDIKAVVDVLKSDFLTQGQVVPQFEDALKAASGAAHAVAVNSATSALHIACMALDVGKGDIVWTSPNTFVASANAARYCSADVDFVDIDAETLNMSVTALEEKLDKADKAGRLPKVVIPVHFAGIPAQMEPIYRLSQKFGFKIIEDASHAIGAKYLATTVGDCAYSDIVVFSFHPVKIITTAEGGAALTQSDELARRMRLLRSHGITRVPGELEDKEQGAWYYEQHCLGYNYRMTELQAALGVTQIQHLDEWIARRHEIADVYDRELARLPFILPKRRNDSYSSLHLYPIQIDGTKTRATRRSVFDHLRAAGIGVNVHYIPVHIQPDFGRFGFKPQDFPNAMKYYGRAISIPMYSGLTPEQQMTVVNELELALAH